MSAHDARTRPLARGRGPGPVPPRQMSRHSRKSSSRHIKAIKSVFEISVNARACMISFDEKTEPVPTDVVLQRIDSDTVRLLWRGPRERRCFIACVEDVVGGNDAENTRYRQSVHKLLHPRIYNAADDEVYFEPAREREHALDIVLDYFSSAIKRSQSATSLLEHTGLMSHKKPLLQLGHSCSELMPQHEDKRRWDIDGKFRYHHSVILSMDSSRDVRVWMRTCGKRSEFDSPWAEPLFIPREIPKFTTRSPAVKMSSLPHRVRVACQTDKTMRQPLPAKYRRIQVPTDLTMGALLCVYRKCLLIGPEKALFMFVRDPGGRSENLRLVSNSLTVGYVHEHYGTSIRVGNAARRVLELTLCLEDTFG